MASTTTEQASEGASGGMPQLDFSTFPNQIFWLLVTLVILYVLLSRVALPRIGGVLAQRKGAITADLRAADEAKQKAVDAERAYNDALSRARSEAGKIVAEAQGDIQKDLAAETVKADAEIAIKVAQAATALDEIRAGAADALA